MPKISRLGGATRDSAPLPRRVVRQAGVDVELLGADSNLFIAGGLQVARDMTVTGRLRVGIPHVTVPDEWGRRWLTARDEAGTRRVKVHMWGGSITDGNPGPSDPLTTSYAGRIETALRAAYGDGGSGYQTWARSSASGSWTSDIGMGSTQVQASAAASRTWTGLRGTEIKLFHRNANLTASLRWRIDGGSWMTVTPPTGFGVEPGVATVGSLSDVSHTVEVEWVSGTVGIHGVQAAYDTGIVTARCAIGGRAYAQYARQNLARFPIGVTNGSPTITSPAPGVFTSAMEDRYLQSPSAGLPFGAQIDTVTDAQTATMNANASATGTIQADLCRNPAWVTSVPLQSVQPGFGEGLGPPDLLIITCGVNDMAYTGGAGTGAQHPFTWAFRDGLANLLKGYYQQYVSPVDYTPDLLIVGEHLANFGDPLGYGPEIAAHAKAVAAGMGAAHVDIWELGDRNYQKWADLNYWNDTVHVNDAGAEAMAAPVIALLTS